VDVSVLLRSGVIADLSMGRWRAEQGIRPEDLGLENLDGAQLQQYMKLGSKTLIPPILQRKLKSIETTARYTVIRYSLDTPFGRFVPAAAYPELDKEMRRFKTQWYKMRDELCEKVKAHEKEVRAGYRELAGQVYTQFRKEGVGKEKYARKFASRILQGMPSVDEIYDRFRFNFVLSRPMMTVLDKSLREQLLSEEVTAGKLTTARLREQQTRKMHAMIAVKYEAEKDKQIEQFLKGVNNQIRTMVGEVADGAKDSLRKNGRLLGKTATHLKNMIARFRMLNILNDQEIESQLKILEGQLKSKTTTPQNRTVNLLAGLNVLAAKARNLSLELRLPAPRSVRGDMLADDEDSSNVATNMDSSHDSLRAGREVLN
jgi:hypothetical protein